MFDDYYSVSDFAKLLRVSKRTIWRSIKSGRINAFRIGPAKKSPLRIARSEIYRMAEFDLEKHIQDEVQKRMKHLEK